MLKENDNLWDNFRPQINEKLTIKRSNIEANGIDLVGKSLDTEIDVKDMLLRRISQDELLQIDFSWSLKKVRFSDQKFATNIYISNIKYNDLRF